MDPQTSRDVLIEILINISMASKLAANDEQQQHDN